MSHARWRSGGGITRPREVGRRYHQPGGGRAEVSPARWWSASRAVEPSNGARSSPPSRAPHPRALRARPRLIRRTVRNGPSLDERGAERPDFLSPSDPLARAEHVLSPVEGGGPAFRRGRLTSPCPRAAHVKVQPSGPPQSRPFSARGIRRRPIPSGVALKAEAHPIPASERADSLQRTEDGSESASIEPFLHPSPARCNAGQLAGRGMADCLTGYLVSRDFTTRG